MGPMGLCCFAVLRLLCLAYCLAHISLASKAMHHPHQLWQGRVQLQGSDDKLHRQEVPREVQAIFNLKQNPYLQIMYLYGLWLCAFVGVVRFAGSGSSALHVGWPSVLVPGVLTVLPFCPPAFLHHAYLDTFTWICTHTHTHMFTPVGSRLACAMLACLI